MDQGYDPGPVRSGLIQASQRHSIGAAFQATEAPLSFVGLWGPGVARVSENLEIWGSRGHREGGARGFVGLDG